MRENQALDLKPGDKFIAPGFMITKNLKRVPYNYIHYILGIVIDDNVLVGFTTKHWSRTKQRWIYKLMDVHDVVHSCNLY